MKTISVTLTVLVMWCVSASAEQSSSSQASPQAPSQTKTPAKVEATTRMPASVPAAKSHAAIEHDEDDIDLNDLIESAQKDGLASIERDLDF